MTPYQEFYVKITALASLCPSFTLNPEIIRIYDRNLSPLGYERIIQALDEILIDRSSRDPFPSIKDIRGYIDPELNPQHEALETVSRIIESISRIGPYQGQRAKDFIGPLGWAVVTREGGWQQVCSVLNDDNLGTIRAQWRQMAAAIFHRAKNGFTSAPTIPNSILDKLNLPKMDCNNLLAPRPWDREEI